MRTLGGKCGLDVDTRACGGVGGDNACWRERLDGEADDAKGRPAEDGKAQMKLGGCFLGTFVPVRLIRPKTLSPSSPTDKKRARARETLGRRLMFESRQLRSLQLRCHRGPDAVHPKMLQ
jgi:hypothetical protein